MSKPVTVDIPHQLGATEARQRIDAGFGRMGDSSGGGLLNLEKQWHGERMLFSGSAMGQRVSGQLDVYDDYVRIELRLPALLALLADKILGNVKREGQRLLEKR